MRIKALTKKRSLYECDVCGKEFERYDKKVFSIHCCSMKCFGLSRRFGTARCDDIQEKMKLTCLKKYGVENPCQSENIKEKKKRSYFEHYGVDHPLKSKIVQKKHRETLLKNYGVENPSQSDEIQSRINHKTAAQKRHETKKKNMTYGKSKSEDKLYEYLCKKFGKDNIKRQVRIYEWNIDFYIKSINSYVQFDGVYWHGLNRDIIIIKESTIPRDKVIYKTYLRDQEQNEWFKMNNIKLVRVTDKQFRKNEICI